MIMKAIIKISEADIIEALCRHVNSEIPPPKGYYWHIRVIKLIGNAGESREFVAELLPANPQKDLQ